MKFLLQIFLWLVLCGCEARSIRSARTETEPNGANAPRSVSVPSSISQFPTPNSYVLHFIYPRPLTNGWLESSTDLMHWEERSDFIITNGQWLVKMDPSKPREFYRAGGEPFP